MGELDADLTLEELSKAIDSLAAGKAPCSNGISTDLIKHCNTIPLLLLHEVLCQCWQEGAIPQDLRDGKIITLYKNKGERSNYNNYRGMSLLSIVSKSILVSLDSPAEAGRMLPSYNAASELKG